MVTLVWPHEGTQEGLRKQSVLYSGGPGQGSPHATQIRGLGFIQDSEDRNEQTNKDWSLHWGLCRRRKQGRGGEGTISVALAEGWALNAGHLALGCMLRRQVLPPEVQSPVEEWLWVTLHIEGMLQAEPSALSGVA